MNKRVNLTIAFLIFAATFIQEQLSLLYMFTTQSIEIHLKDLLCRLTLEGKSASHDIYKSCYYAFSYSGIRQVERKLAIEKLGSGIAADTKLSIAYNI